MSSRNHSGAGLLHCSFQYDVTGVAAVVVAPASNRKPKLRVASLIRIFIMSLTLLLVAGASALPMIHVSLHDTPRRGLRRSVRH